MSAADGDVEEVPAQFECAVCLKLLLDPVTVTCGHTFCRICLEQSLGYRSLCAVCRAPVVSGQSINILVRDIIAGQYPRALAQRLREAEQDMRAGERQADDARRREASGAGAAGDGPDTGMPVLPLLQWAGAWPMVLPHCRVQVDLQDDGQESALTHALQGGRRLGIVEAGATFDDQARPLGVCVEVEAVEPQATASRCSRVRLLAKFRFWLVEEPQAREGGFFLGRCEAFFDAALTARELLGAAPGQAQGDEQAAGADAGGGVGIAEAAREALDLLEGQLASVGQAGRYEFGRLHGEVLVLPPAGNVTSASMERLSFWLLGTLVPEGGQRSRWLVSLDTRGRLEYTRRRLAQCNGRRLLDLPGATSWMNGGQGALGSIAIMVAIIALLLGKAMGLFEEGRRHRSAQDQWLQNAAALWQLLR